MKALISPSESVFWVSGWELVGDDLAPVLSQVDGAQRVAEVQIEPFDVAPPLHWVDCPEECAADEWYYKDGELLKRPQDAPYPDLAE